MLHSRSKASANFILGFLSLLYLMKGAPITKVYHRNKSSSSEGSPASFQNIEVSIWTYESPDDILLNIGIESGTNEWIEVMV